MIQPAYQIYKSKVKCSNPMVQNGYENTHMVNNHKTPLLSWVKLSTTTKLLNVIWANQMTRLSRKRKNNIFKTKN